MTKFRVMSNPFNIKKLTEKEAIEKIKKAGFKVKKEKHFGKVVVVYPVGNEDEIYNFIESLIEQKIFTTNNGVAIYE